MASASVRPSCETPASTQVRPHLSSPSSSTRLIPLADPRRLATADADLEFKKLARSIAVQVQKVAANTAAVAKFVDLLGSSKDNPTLRNRLCVPL